MPITAERISRLREFGLSEYAARAYLALLDLGVGEARDVSTLSRVPTSKIYHTLEHLHAKGLVVVRPEFPKKYEPVPFLSFLEKLEQEHKSVLASILDTREELGKLFAVVGNVEVGDRGGFTLIRGRRNVLARCGEVMIEAKRDLLLMGTVGTCSRPESLMASVGEIQRRGVRVRLLAPVVREVFHGLDAVASGAEIRARGSDGWDGGKNVAVGIADGARAFLTHFAPDDGHPFRGNDTGFYTDHEGIVGALQALIEPWWVRAIPYDVRRREIETGSPPEFTRFYLTRGEAAQALANLVESGIGSIRASNGSPAQHLSAMGERLLAKTAALRIHVRVVLNLDSPGVLEEYRDVARRFPNVEIRHQPPGGLPRTWLLGEHEVMFSPLRASYGLEPSEARDLVIHTSHRATVESLKEDFEETWKRAQGLEAREAEIAGATTRAT